MYPVAGTIRAVVNHYEAKSADASEARADRARRVKNEADISEIALAEKMNLYMLKSDFVEIPRDWIAAARRAIQDAPNLPEKAKLAMMEILQSSKLNDFSRG